MVEHVDEIINFLVKNELFPHLKISCYLSDFTEKFIKEQIVRYAPSEEHRKKCKDDLCHINARLEFIDHRGRVTLSKNIRRRSRT